MGGEHVCENDNDYDDDGDDDDVGDDDDDGDDGAQSSSIVRLLDSCVCFWQSVHLEPK